MRMTQLCHTALAASPRASITNGTTAGAADGGEV